MILDIDDVLVSSDIITEHFCCDLDACKGICCVEGDAGAPVTLEEIAGIEDSLDSVWNDMTAQAQAVVDKQGVAYNDCDGELVTSIVGGKNCVFTCYEHDCCLCALERAHRAGKTDFVKPTPSARSGLPTALWRSTITAGMCASPLSRRDANWVCPYTASSKDHSQGALARSGMTRSAKWQSTSENWNNNTWW